MSGIHLVPPIQAARGAGAKLVVIDPRATPLAAQADLHLALRPGTDLVVALAVIRGCSSAAAPTALPRRARDRRRRAAPPRRAVDDRARGAAAGVAARRPERFARLYADELPRRVRCGWGLERNRNGGSAVAAVLALPAVAGKFGVRGGGYTMSQLRRPGASTAGAAAQASPTRGINMNQPGGAALRHSPPIEVLFVYNSNPLDDHAGAGTGAPRPRARRPSAPWSSTR